MQRCEGLKVCSSFFLSWIVYWGQDDVMWRIAIKGKPAKGHCHQIGKGLACSDKHLDFIFKAVVSNFKVVCSSNVMCILFLITPSISCMNGVQLLSNTWKSWYYEVLFKCKVLCEDSHMHLGELSFLSQFLIHFGEQRTRVVNFEFILEWYINVIYSKWKRQFIAWSQSSSNY